MIELLRTNDIVLLSVIEMVFKEASVHYFIADSQMSTIGLANALQQRILVRENQHLIAKRLLADAGLVPAQALK